MWRTEIKNRTNRRAGFCIRLGLLLLASLIGPMLVGLATPAHAETLVGATAGSFGVSPFGAAVYNVPITVVPGTATMEPNLSINYSSSLKEGFLGLGFSLQGLGQVTRCGRTKSLDGQHGSVNFDADDRFCLNGERLILVAGTYGSPGAEYRTEIDEFARVTSSGTAGNGPASFTVERKNGLIEQYGTLDDSRIEAPNRSDVRTWALSYVIDRNGNYVRYRYIENNEEGEFVPSHIEYTGSIGAEPAEPRSSVAFEYEDGPRRLVRYQGGARISTFLRLKALKTYADTTGSDLVREYRFDYELSPHSGQSVLTQITECDNEGNCLPATEFIREQAVYGSLPGYPKTLEVGMSNLEPGRSTQPAPEELRSAAITNFFLGNMSIGGSGKPHSLFGYYPGAIVSTGDWDEGSGSTTPITIQNGQRDSSWVLDAHYFYDSSDSSGKGNGCPFYANTFYGEYSTAWMIGVGIQKRYTSPDGYYEYGFESRRIRVEHQNIATQEHVLVSSGLVDHVVEADPTVRVADVNGDHCPDLVVAHTTADGPRLSFSFSGKDPEPDEINVPGWVFLPAPSTALTSEEDEWLLTDANNDDFLDLLTFDTAGSVQTYLGYQSAYGPEYGFSYSSTASPSWSAACSPNDDTCSKITWKTAFVNRDRLPDLIRIQGNVIDTALNRGDGSFEVVSQVLDPIQAPTGPDQSSVLWTVGDMAD
ncbi:MAG: SpvB/TcaC N-terminal domain-containing protein, partial [Myxococcota bacterium]|nr:SpvB/TcaC N-terminal domain-containing protein [Myxococcota bacterium]